MENNHDDEPFIADTTTLTFFVNGNKVQIDDNHIDPQTTLASYIRNNRMYFCSYLINIQVHIQSNLLSITLI